MTKSACKAVCKSDFVSIRRYQTNKSSQRFTWENIAVMILVTRFRSSFHIRTFSSQFQFLPNVDPLSYYSHYLSVTSEPVLKHLIYENQTAYWKRNWIIYMPEIRKNKKKTKETRISLARGYHFFCKVRKLAFNVFYWMNLISIVEELPHAVIFKQTAEIL